MSDTITVIGATGSPYTRKLVALLRFRRIPYKVIWGDPSAVLAERGLPKAKVNLLPTVLFPNGADTPDVALDTTPIIRRLEAEYPKRSVIPANPALAFFDYLLEDFADEWGTKYMFHYRWHFAADANNASTILPLAMNLCHSEEQLAFLKGLFAERQISRLGVVGSSPDTAPVIEASYKRLLLKLEAVFAQTPYLLGNRPSASDFAFYGQLSQLIGFDPTSRKIAHDIAPRTVAWVGLMEDLSGTEMSAADWIDPTSISLALKALLSEVGTMYVPALIANAEALGANQPRWQATIDGAKWQQQSFPYQGKCLMWIREEFTALQGADKALALQTLDATGCADLVTGLRA